MSEYSIYTITDEDRQFSEWCTVVHCADDVEAIETAAQWLDIHDVELWESTVSLRVYTQRMSRCWLSPSHPFGATLNERGPAVQ